MRFLKRSSKKEKVRIVPMLAKQTGTFYCGDKKTIDAVIDRYFTLAKEHILDGGEWNFKNAFCICVHKKKVRNKQIMNKVTKTVKINIRRPGELNKLVGYGDALKRHHYRFRPSSELQAALDEILFNTNKEFRYAPTR